MLNIKNHEIINSFYRNILSRDPGSDELKYWVDRLNNGSFDEILFGFMNCDEYVGKNANNLPHQPGHFYSPVVDIDQINIEQLETSDLDEQGFDCLGLSQDKMLDFWSAIKNYVLHESFCKDRCQSKRYYYNNPVFCKSDASVLRAMITVLKPRNIVEIGSGFSSAVMLDTLDELNLVANNVVFIDPYPDRLKSLLTLNTNQPVTIIEKPVQNVDKKYFELLGAGDILFIDSSHVLKRQSDVCYELFDLLPSLKPGVIIHFHDIFYPFEYPADWIINRKYSLNELYALRAFLMHNKSYEIVFFNN